MILKRLQAAFLISIIFGLFVFLSFRFRQMPIFVILLTECLVFVQRVYFTTYWTSIATAIYVAAVLKTFEALAVNEMTARWHYHLLHRGVHILQADRAALPRHVLHTLMVFLNFSR